MSFILKVSLFNYYFVKFVYLLVHIFMEVCSLLVSDRSDLDLV